MNQEKMTIRTQDAIQKSQQLAMEYGHQAIETGHLLNGILEVDEHVIPFIFKKCGVDFNTVKAAITSHTKSYAKVKGGSIYLSQSATKALAFAEKSMKNLGDEFMAIEHVLLGILATKGITSQILKDAGVNEKDLKAGILELRKGGKVDSRTAEDNYNSLGKYAVNLNEMAQKGKLDPVIGRDEEIRRVLQILSRRTKNNPILIGEPGVGKTAIAEGLAHRIINGDVPDNLKSKGLYSLDMGALVAGAKFKGEFEERLKSVVKEVVSADGEIILFIDEIHTLVGAGGGEGAMDAANILKPALARGELRAIGATTLNEYQKYIEKDKALERRFQKVLVDEPDTADAISIMRGLKEKYETHHKVRIKDESIISAVELSQRYINDRFLPDKAIDLMDEAASKLRLEINSSPQALDDLERKIRQLEIEREAIKREKDKVKLDQLAKQLSELSAERDDLKAKWQNEKDVVEGIQSAKEEIESLKLEANQAERAGDFGKVAELRYGRVQESEAKLAEHMKSLEVLQSGSPLIKEEVDAEDIADVVSKWTGIPVSKMLQSEREKLLRLEDELHTRVIGQDEAIVAISDAIRRSRAGLQDEKRPIGSFIFLGTTGVGKTELAKALADYLFNNENAMTRIDMSEYQERHSVSRLVGAPPGYVGYDEGGQLTEAVRRKPYSIVLLDEIEKAHPDVFNILLQVLDDGRLTDNKGRVVNFKNTLIIMTSNLGSHLIQEKMEGMISGGNDLAMIEARNDVFELLKKTLRPEFLNRIDDIIMFTPLNREDVLAITKLQLDLVMRMLNGNGLDLAYTDEAADWIAQLGYDPQFGARPIKRVIQKQVLNELSKEILGGKFTKDSLITVDSFEQKIVFRNTELQAEMEKTEAL
jgi:ATP-dependent Clp protease ATP-binding subunit ClpB